MQKSVVILLSIFILSGCVSQATFGDAITEGEPTPLPTAVVPSRPVYEVQRGDIIDQRSYVGRISAINRRELAFSIDGRLAEVHFSVGDTVTMGDVLAELDTSILENQLLNAQEELAIAQALLESASNQVTFAQRRAELQVDLAQTFLDYANSRAGNPPTPDDNLLIRQREIELELAQLTLNQLDQGVDPALEFDVARAQEQVDHINQLIAQSVLLAPMDGQLTSFLAKVGDNVVAFGAVGLISDLSELEVTDVMDNAELSELSEGLVVTLQRANSPEDVFEGIIHQLPQPFGSGSDSLIHIRFVNEPSFDLQLGERISFLVTIAERQDVLWLPLTAIRQFSGRNFVVIQDEGVERRVDVTLGLQGNQRVEILEGVLENQRVIAP